MSPNLGAERLIGTSPHPYLKWVRPYIHSFCNRNITVHKAGTPLKTCRVVLNIGKNLLVVANSWGSTSNTFESHQCNIGGCTE